MCAVDRFLRPTNRKQNYWTPLVGYKKDEAQLSKKAEHSCHLYPWRMPRQEHVKALHRVCNKHPMLQVPLQNQVFMEAGSAGWCTSTTAPICMYKYVHMNMLTCCCVFCCLFFVLPFFFLNQNLCCFCKMLFVAVSGFESPSTHATWFLLPKTILLPYLHKRGYKSQNSKCRKLSPYFNAFFLLPRLKCYYTVSQSFFVVVFLFCCFVCF